MKSSSTSISTNYVCKDLFPENWEYDDRAKFIPGDFISIIVTAHNLCDDLQPCMESILAQTHENIEVIVVNDGSTDDTPAVAEFFAATDRRVTAIHQKQENPCAARLAGLAAAKGYWIGFVNGTDCVLPYMYEQLLDNALTYDADISQCVYHTRFPSPGDMGEKEVTLTEWDGNTAFAHLMSPNPTTLPLVTNLYKSTLIRKLPIDELKARNLRDEQGLLMDFYLSRNCTNVIGEPSPFYIHFPSAHEGTTNEEKLLDPIRVLKVLRKETKDRSPSLEDHVNIAIIHTLCNLVALSPKENPELIRHNRKKAQKSLRSILPTLKGNPLFSKKRLWKGLWAAYLPHSYRLVQQLRNKLNRNPKT